MIEIKSLGLRLVQVLQWSNMGMSHLIKKGVTFNLLCVMIFQQYNDSKELQGIHPQISYQRPKNLSMNTQHIQALCPLRPAGIS